MLRKLAVFVSCICIGYVLFELYVLFINPPPASPLVQRIPSADWYQYKPYMNFGEDPFATAYPFVASADPSLNISEKKPAGVARIVIQGNSVAAIHAYDRKGRISGLFTPPGYWPKRIRDSLDEGLRGAGASTRSEVVMAGGQSYASSNDLAKLVFLVGRYSPDVVVFLDFYSDLYANLVLGTRPGVDAISPAIETRLAHPLLLEAFRLTEGTLPTLHEAISKLIEQRLNEKADPNVDVKIVADAILRNYLAADAYSRGIGAKFLVVLQPIARLHPYPRPARDYPLDPAKVIAIRDLLKQSMTEHHLPFLDLTEMFSDPSWKGGSPFVDDVHFYDEGYLYFCDRLAASLLDLLKSDQHQTTH